jgi:hypothetical protein
LAVRLISTGTGEEKFPGPATERLANRGAGAAPSVMEGEARLGEAGESHMLVMPVSSRG